MKVSLNWLKQFTDVQLGVEELVEKIGTQLGAVEEVIDIGKRYEGIVVAKVVTCGKHPNADKLSVCMIDDGGAANGVKRDDNGCVQVVCGAANVKAGMLVAWLPPGATVPSTFDKDPFVLEARELRGVTSNGMLASAAELAISDDHKGILEIDLDAKPGQSFTKLYHLDDYVIDIENKMFTHRPDCFGILGVAREIAGIQNIKFKSPEWYLEGLGRTKSPKDKLPLKVINEVPELVPRFMAIAMSGVEVKPSPVIVQSYLSRVGLKPINNVVDVTNYLMYLTGQPLHAYDYDKLQRAANSERKPVSLEARMSRKGESLKLLNGKEITLEDNSTILITSNDVPVGVGGVMGGADTEVDENTKNIVLECANFDMYSVRKTSMKYGLFTDAVTRFNKGQSPLQNSRVLEEVVATIGYVAFATVASEIFDLGANKLPKQPPITVSKDFINTRLGLKHTAHDMAKRLENVEFKVSVKGDSLTVIPPFWRTDIHISEDLVEEVGRLIGYDELPVELPKRTIRPTKRNVRLDLKAQIREALSRAGANEVLTYSFVHGNLLDAVGQDKERAFRLSNALSPDLQYYRFSLTPNLLEKVHPNIKAGHEQFTIFELGKGHQKGINDPLEPGAPNGESLLSMVFAADARAAKSYEGAAYYQAVQYFNYLTEQLNRKGGIKLTPFRLNDEQKQQTSAPFEPKRTARIEINGELAGFIGEYKTSVQKALKLPVYCAGFEVNTEILMKAAESKQYKALSRYPKVEQDITLKIKGNTLAGEVIEIASKLITENSTLGDVTANIQVIDAYQAEDATTKNITLRLSIASYERTLTDQEVSKLLDDLSTRLHDKLGTERV